MSESLDELIEDKNNPERVFPILNKFDRCWTIKTEMTFCDLYMSITEGQRVTDLEFTKLLDKYIEENGIK